MAGFSYVVPQPEKRENMPDGDFLTVLTGIEEKMDKHGTYIEITEEYLDPGENLGRTDTERWYVGAYDLDRKKRAAIGFAKFVREVANISPGEILTDAHMVGKRYIKRIQNKEGKNGYFFQNTLERILVPGATHAPSTAPTVNYGNISIPNQAVGVGVQAVPVPHNITAAEAFPATYIPNNKLNDEVPFQ